MAKDEGPRSILDVARIAKVKGGGFITRGIALLGSGASVASEDAHQLRTAGAISATGVRRILAHHDGLPVLCKAAFDEKNAENPGWCAGVQLEHGQKARLLPKAERDALWSEIGVAAGVPKTGDLLKLSFAPAATCPTVDKNP